MQEAKTVEIFASSTGNTSNVEQQTGPICKKIVNEKGYYPVKFCGLIYVGTIGSVEQIESGVWDVLKKDEPKRDVYLDLGETDIVVLCSNTQKVNDAKYENVQRVKSLQIFRLFFNMVIQK